MGRTYKPDSGAGREVISFLINVKRKDLNQGPAVYADDIFAVVWYPLIITCVPTIILSLLAIPLTFTKLLIWSLYLYVLFLRHKPQC